MTKSTITREQLEEWVAQFDEDGGCDATDRQLEALIRQSLAAMDSEPVAWTDEQELRDVDRGGCGYLFTVNPVTPHADERRIILLYRHAQPVPVVPPKQHWEELCRQHPEMSIGDAVIRAAWWNHCRAAMLTASPQSPGSEPATVPGKWIPVSERMPIEFEAVIAFDGDQVYGEAMYSSDDGFTIDGYEPCDRLNLQNVTHWMPLPAAPREVK
ncbi:DUF551 domain-containing protein [Klebsiella pneumoniae]|nr:DUF551 domain-containing protein [Klebsiella pneumoniae]MCP6598968.1 DUF551 domain-containing protein [Klebsiella pneumoniae]MDC6569422.1 DUF551 domain-containing protein [Klebsiella pneumoniae]MDC6572759.1 DUF551 domain-containing protein [Klebsiella pneumoniae]